MKLPGKVARGRRALKRWVVRPCLNSASTKAVGSQGRIIWSAHPNHCSVVISNKPKVLTGLDQNGEWPGWGALTSPHADVAPPAYGWDLRDPRGY